MKDYIDVNRECYNHLAEEYKYRSKNKSQSEESANTLCEFLLNTVSLSQNAIVLEIGPGAGEVLRCFSNLNYTTVGVELSPKMAEIAHETSPQSVILIDNILNVDFPDNQFDIIFLGAIIHLFPLKDAEKLLNCVLRWLKTNGRVFINTTCNKLNDEGYFIKKDYSGKLKRYRKFWTEPGFYDFITSIGFSILDTMYTNEDDRGKRWVAYVCKKHDLVVDRIVSFDNFNVEQVHMSDNPKVFYEIARRKKCVILIPVDYSNFILINEYRIAINQSILQFPAGKIECFEKPEDAAKRELQEETGYVFTQIEYLGSFYSAPHFCDEEFFVFGGTVKKKGFSSPTIREDISVVSINQNDIEQMMKKNLIQDAKSIVAFNMWRNKYGEI